MKKKLPSLDINPLDNLFSTEEERQDNRLEKIMKIPLEEIHDFKDHPFKVRMDEDMEKLVGSVRENGVLVPVLVRPDKDGNGYEMIAGHRRKYAMSENGMAEIDAIVRNLDDDQATIIMVDSNIQREHILPSERGFAYKMKLDAMKRQGLRTDLTSTPLVEKLSVAELGKEYNESRETVRRYIRLTELIPQILDMVDNDLIALRPAVEISFLDESHQEYLLDVMQQNDCTPSHAQTLKMHKLDKEGALTTDVIDNIMAEEKPNQVEKIKIPKNRIKNFFNNKTSEKEIEDTIIKALELYQRIQQKKRSNRESR